MVQRMDLSKEATRLIDEGVETLRWCRQHLGERGASERLRRLEITLASLALSLDYEMDGQNAKTAQALRQADWREGNQARIPKEPHDFMSNIFDH